MPPGACIPITESAAEAHRIVGGSTVAGPLHAGFRMRAARSGTAPGQSLEFLMNVSVHRAKTWLSASLATARRSERGLSTSDHKERDDHHAEESYGHDRPGRQVHHCLLHWYRAAVRSLAACAEIRASCVEVSMFEGTRPATTRGMSFLEMPMSSNCRSSRRWSAAAAWPRCQRCVAREMRSATVARKPARRDDAGWVPDRLNSDMIAAPFTKLIEPRAQECEGGVHGNGCVRVRSGPSRYALIVFLEAPRRRTRAFEPLGAKSGSGMALGKQTSCFLG
jgi:hypothetical protein